MKYGKTVRITAAVLLLTVLLCGCGSNAPVQAQGKSYFSYFDTVSYVYSYAGDSAERFDERSAEVSAVLEKYHKLFDIYHEYSGINNLCTVNKLAGGEPVTVEPELMEFLLYAKEMYTLTDGKMNVMLGSVLKLWHECRETAETGGKAVLPTEDALREAAGHTDIELLEMDETACTVRISDPLAAVDVGALGKGYAVEKAAQRLQELKAKSYVLNVGGNIRAIGTKKDGSAWNTAIRDPMDDMRYAAKLPLADTACVTSGVYERFFTVNGTRYHHVIDPDTLYPARYFASVTVLTKDSGLADALSTALFCMSYEDGLALVQKIGNTEVLWIGNDGTMLYTDGLEDIISLPETETKS